MMTPGCICPRSTRTAPASSTAISPALSRKLTTGFEIAMTLPARFSASATSRLMRSNRARS